MIGQMALNLKINNQNAANNSAVSKSLEKISSGFRINRSADDASGLGISENMRAQIREATTCKDNVSYGINLANTADGALEEVHSILQRTRELCVQGANGTYAEGDRQAIAGEMEQLFQEIDRISDATEYNGIPLLKGRIYNIYDENVTDIKIGETTLDALDITELHEFGDLNRPEQVFETDGHYAEHAKASITLDPSIKSSADMDGKTIVFGHGSYRYQINFQDSSKKPVTTEFGKVPGNLNATYTVSYDSTTESIEDVMKKMSNAYPVSSYIQTGVTTFDAATNTLSLTSNQEYNASQQIEHDGIKTDHTYTDCTYGNNIFFESVSTVGGLGSFGKEIPPEFTNYTEAFGSLDFTSSTIPKYVADKLKSQSMTIGKKSISLGFIREGMTVSEFKTAIEKAYGAPSDHSAKFTVSGNSINVKLTYPDPGKANAVEQVISIPDQTVSGGLKPGYPKKVTFDGSTCSGVETPGKPNETGPKLTVSIGDLTNKNSTITINGKTFYLHNATLPDGNVDTYGTYIDISSCNQEQILEKLKNSLNFGTITPTIDGDKIVLTSSNPTYTFGTTSGGASKTVTITSYEDTKYSVIYGHDPMNSNSQAILDVKLPQPIDIKSLDKTGFVLNGHVYEFTDGGKQTNPSSTLIDIAGCKTTEDIMKKIQAAPLNVRLHTPDDGTIQLFSTSSITTASTAHGRNPANYLPLKNGFTSVSGALNANKNQFTGGTADTPAGVGVDFSHVNSQEELNKLIGTGFRVNCSSCPDEYINIIFRKGNDPAVPDFFYKDNGAGKPPSKIQNIIVDVTQINNPSDITNAIVDQTKSKLKHFTEFEAKGNILYVHDKRNDPDQGANGKVIDGVLTNFKIDVVVSEGKDDQDLPIYTNSVNMEYHYIKLPIIDTESLNLGNPRPVDMSTRLMPYAWLNKIDKATDRVSAVRGSLGADVNTLEHIYNNLTEGELNTTAAESRLRDLQVPQEMTKFTLSQIKSQASQAMIAQSSKSFSDRVLALLK